MEYARYARPTRKSEALLLAAYAQRSAEWMEIVRRTAHLSLGRHQEYTVQSCPRNMMLLGVAMTALVYGAAAVAHNVTSVKYDKENDKLIIEIAYRGTHENHHFSVQWGECRQLDDERKQTYGLLVDSDPMDPARQNFTKILELDMASFPCRPARATIRTATGFNRSVDIPAVTKVQSSKPNGR
jgi:hypothetical protein